MKITIRARIMKKRKGVFEWIAIKGNSFLEIAAKLSKINFLGFEFVRYDGNQEYAKGMIARKVDQIRSARTAVVIG